MPGQVFSRNTILIAVTCISSLLPYLILYTWFSLDITRGYDFSLPASFFGSIIWLLLTIWTLVVRKGEHKFFWLFALFPVAFGPWLVIAYMKLHAWLTGFAP